MNPLTLYQERLNQASKAMLEGDFEAWLATLDLPYLLCTLEADFVLRNAEDLAPTFWGLVGIMRRNGVTHYERVARGAELVRGDRIEGWHFSHLLVNGEWMTAPYAARQVLVRRPGGWFFSEAHFPYHTDRLPITEDVVRQAMRPGFVPGAQPTLIAGLAWPARTGQNSAAPHLPQGTVH